MRRTISKAAKAADVSVETIRFYERRGLVSQPMTPVRGYREYDLDTIEQIRFIRHAQEIGFSLSDIQELMELRSDPDSDCSDVRLRAVAKLHDVNIKIERLLRVQDALETLIAACPGEGAVGSCSILKEITKHESRPDYAVHSSSQTLKRSTLMKTTEFTVDGMHCDGCAKTAETLLSAVPGVRKAEVSYADRHARVLHDPDQASVTDLYAAVSRAGYVASDKSE
tara:strand:- start:2108 stop:2782 length:675 start_codon:yes stop_codon:yes gene_type:complete